MVLEAIARYRAIKSILFDYAGPNEEEMKLIARLRVRYEDKY